MDERTYNAWILLRPVPDMDGQWEAHCLDFDIVTYGNSPVHALQMIAEAVNETVIEDLNGDRDPMDRRAPKKIWDEFWKLSAKSLKIDNQDEALRSPTRWRWFLAQQTFRFICEDHVAREAGSETPLAMVAPKQIENQQHQ